MGNELLQNHMKWRYNDSFKEYAVFAEGVRINILHNFAVKISYLNIRSCLKLTL